MKQLTFSSEHLSIASSTLNGSLAIDRPSIVVNVSDAPVVVEADNSTFSLRQSRLLQNTSVSGEGSTVVIVQTKDNDFSSVSPAVKGYIQQNWSYDNPLAVDTNRSQQHAVHTSNVLKSEKDVVNGYHLFFCYLKRELQGTIHRIHDLYEVHTQILGMGAMQKYTEDNFESLFETSPMSPGYTHYPYYDNNRKYPWHTYVATTDSVWMAIVAYE